MKNLDLEKCTGCGACASLCPEGCIRMCPDEKGFFVPTIDEEKCVECGICEEACHLNQSHRSRTDESRFFGAWAKDKEERLGGSSGGVFGLLAEKVMMRGGVVFGAAFDEGFKGLSHKNTDEVGLEQLKKSKYLESRMEDTIGEIKTFLEAGREVLFCGTPCQAMGVRAALGKNYEKLTICDFLCHGVPSQKLYGEYIRALEKKVGAELESISFRSKKLGWKTYCVYAEFKNKKRYLATGFEDPYLRLFLGNRGLRKSCYNCNRAECGEADITLGDFWGVTRLRDFEDSDEGISLVSVRTQKGEKLFEEIKEDLENRELSFDMAEYAFRERNIYYKELDIEGFEFFGGKKDIAFLKTKLKSALFKIPAFRKIIYRKK